MLEMSYAPVIYSIALTVLIPRSIVSAGGTRHVKRRRKRADGTYSDEESYHSDMDVEGKKRRQKRRGERKVAAMKEAKKNYDKGKRRPGKKHHWQRI